MDFIPPPNRDDFKDQKEYEDALKEWEKEFKKFSNTKSMFWILG